LNDLTESFVELIRRAATDLPADVEAALREARDREEPGSAAEGALDTVLENVAIARDNSGVDGSPTPICQDTGVPIFYVYLGAKTSEGTKRALRRQIEVAVVEATERSYLRPNAVDPVSGRNSGNNLGRGFPTFHFEAWGEEAGRDPEGFKIDLLLKGGGSENVSAQYKLPYSGGAATAPFHAERDLDGVRNVVLEAVYRAQGKGCAPGVLGVAIGGDRGSGYVHAKEQLFRPLDDVNPEPALAELEETLLRDANALTIGPMGFGGKTTLFGIKVGAYHRLPACFFVSIAYNCWALRRATMTFEGEEVSFQ
jgi:fumarate hydratase class I